MRWWDRSADAGSATLWTLVFAAVLTLVGMVSVMIAAGLTTHRKAAAAADLAALAGAGRSLTDERVACEVATRSAMANDATLVSCRIVDRSVVVVVRATSDSPWLPGFDVAARAGHG